MKKLLLPLLVVLSLWSNLLHANTYVAGTDYTIINAAAKPQAQVTVTEFFNYGCPWCALIDKNVEAWQKTLPAYVTFDRVPLTFEQGWNTYAKAYYFAKALGIEATITPKLFLAIHGADDQQNNDLSSATAIINFFVKNGVDRKTAEATFNQGSATLDAQVQYGLVLMQQYQINAIPCFIVGEKYLVTLGQGQAKNGERLMQVVNYLIAQAHSK